MLFDALCHTSSLQQWLAARKLAPVYCAPVHLTSECFCCNMSALLQLQPLWLGIKQDMLRLSCAACCRTHKGCQQTPRPSPATGSLRCCMHAGPCWEPSAASSLRCTLAPLCIKCAHHFAGLLDCGTQPWGLFLVCVP